MPITPAGSGSARQRGWQPAELQGQRAVGGDDRTAGSPATATDKRPHGLRHLVAATTCPTTAPQARHDPHQVPRLPGTAPPATCRTPPRTPRTSADTRTRPGPGRFCRSAGSPRRSRGPGRWSGPPSGPARSVKQSLARDLLAAFGPGMLVLADRNFQSHSLVRDVLATGAHILWRASASFAVLRADPDRGARRRQLPRAVEPGPQERRAADHGAGHRVHRAHHNPRPAVAPRDPPSTGSPTSLPRVFALVTDLLDIQAYPAPDLACAYPMRLRAETVIGHHKTDMGAGMLACPDRPDRHRHRGLSPSRARSGPRHLPHQPEATSCATAPVAPAHEPPRRPRTSPPQRPAQRGRRHPSIQRKPGASCPGRFCPALPSMPRQPDCAAGHPSPPCQQCVHAVQGPVGSAHADGVP